ncbi:hypothetical protein [Algibacillus agarilyticus]|uniref:hypothetical protein n=1 Tax=Algibacillus agarilyticus TaxID=2234133 RepID=UPI000DCFC966|nr:hypothetical protein [Algibacillus agarilyticus]
MLLNKIKLLKITLPLLTCCLFFVSIQYMHDKENWILLCWMGCNVFTQGFVFILSLIEGSYFKMIGLIGYNFLVSSIVVTSAIWFFEFAELGHFFMISQYTLVISLIIPSSFWFLITFFRWLIGSGAISKNGSN